MAACRAAINQPDTATIERIAALPILAGPLDLASELARVHAGWFSDLPRPACRWSRRSPRRRLTHLRFGCYRRTAPGTVELNPRLDRPWMARCFVEHVLHHELCHHRQAQTPVSQRREAPHSRRFRSWERGYPGLDEALLWERHALPWLLDDAPPPWYAAPRKPS